MNATLPSIEKRPAKVEPVGSHSTNPDPRAGLRSAAGLVLLTVVIVLSAYGAVHSSGVVPDLP
jgi:hypothetical protein